MHKAVSTLVLAAIAVLASTGAFAESGSALCNAVDDNSMFVAEDAEGYLLINILGMPEIPPAEARLPFEQQLGECAVAHIKAQLAADSTLSTVREIALDFVLMKSLDEYDEVDFSQIKRLGAGTARHRDGAVSIEEMHLDWSALPR